MRCSSAAPWFFKPKTIDGVGKFQDGGLTHNNPVNLALWEAKTIWPEGKLDVLVSLGTGTTKPLSADPPSPSSLSGSTSCYNALNDGFIPRLYHTLINSLNGQKTWFNLLNRIPDELRHKYQRLNVKLEGNSEPEIDDVDQISTMRESTILQLDRSQLKAISSALVASSFYFKLTQKYWVDPTVGTTRASGKIICRFGTDYQTAL